jgi:hypothetical protein
MQIKTREIARAVVVPILSGIVLYALSEPVSRYPGYLPTITKEVFEQLIQVNSTILGFTIVGILYYLGKFEDSKKDYVRHWFGLVKSMSVKTLETNQIVDIFQEAIKGTKLSKAPVYSGILNFFLDVKQQGLDRVDALTKLEPQVMNLFGIRDLVEWYLKIVTVYIGAAIVLSFLALFMFSNGLDTMAWRVFFVIISLMILAGDYYYISWKSMRGLSDIIDRTTLAMERAYK